jgi:hypothetical protein
MAKSVLIVEDNEHQRNIYASIVRFSGYEILEAENGVEAIEKHHLCAKGDPLFVTRGVSDFDEIFQREKRWIR